MSGTGKALFNLFANVTKAAAGALAASKPVDEGCNKCPDGERPPGYKPRPRSRVRRYRPARRRP